MPEISVLERFGQSSPVRTVHRGVAGWREWRRTALPVAVTLGVARVGPRQCRARATSDDVEDGVLWVERAAGVVAAEVGCGFAGGSSGDQARRCPARHRRAAGREPRLSPRAAAPCEAGAPHLHAAAAGQPRGRAGRARADPERRRPLLLRPRARRHLHAAGRRRGSSPAPERSGDAAFLLALGRVLRRVHLFVHRPAAIASTGSSTGATSSRSLLLPPLFLHFTLVFPERPHIPRLLRATGAVAAGHLPAGGGSRRDARARATRDRASIPTTSCAWCRCWIGSSSCTSQGFSPRRWPCCCARCSASARSPSKRQLRWIVWGTALGALPFALGYAIPFASASIRRCRWGCRRFRSAFIPLAFASAIVRYRLMDVEIILKRLLVYTVGGGRHRRDLRADPPHVGRLLRTERRRTSLAHRVPGHGDRDSAGASR